MSPNQNMPVELEGGEVVKSKEGNAVEVKGKSHEQGGVDLSLPVGTFVFSKKLKGPNGRTMADREKTRTQRENKVIKALEDNPTDPLNRFTFNRVLDLNETERQQDMMVQGLADLVDQYGQKGGTQVLSQVAPTMEGYSPSMDEQSQMQMNEEMAMQEQMAQPGMDQGQMQQGMGDQQMMEQQMMAEEQAMAQGQMGQEQMMQEQMMRWGGMVKPMRKMYGIGTDPMGVTQGTYSFKNALGSVAQGTADPTYNYGNVYMSREKPKTAGEDYMSGNIPSQAGQDYLSGNIPTTYGQDYMSGNIDEGKKPIRIPDMSFSPAAQAELNKSGISAVNEPAPPSSGGGGKDKPTTVDRIAGAVQKFAPALGPLGVAFGSVAPLAATIINRLGDKRSSSVFENYGTAALEANTASMRGAASERALANRNIALQSASAGAAARGSARGVNTLRGLSQGIAAQAGQQRAQTSAQYQQQMAGMMDKRASLLQERDKVVLDARKKAIDENEERRDNFFTNIATNLVGVGKGMQFLGAMGGTDAGGQADLFKSALGGYFKK